MSEYREVTPELLETIGGLGFTLFLKVTDLNGRHEGGEVSAYVEINE